VGVIGPGRVGVPGEVLVPGGLPMMEPGVPEAGLVVPLAVPEETPEGEDAAPPTAWGGVDPV